MKSRFETSSKASASYNSGTAKSLFFATDINFYYLLSTIPCHASRNKRNFTLYLLVAAVAEGKK
jgi:hypothetical protein